MKRRLETFITTKPRGVFPSFFRAVLMPLSWLYGAVVWGRNCCYKFGIIKQRRLPCFVISVGNIVVGGTGKTPAAAAIAKLVQKLGLRAAILLRGYKRLYDKKEGRNEAIIVSDGEKLLRSREKSGDEAEMLAHQLIDIPIIVGKKRDRAGEAALEYFQSNVLILDDGFQHRQLARDLDILTIDATRPDGTGALLPVGTMREPKSAIKRADIILLTRTDAADINIAHLKNSLNQLAPKTPIIESVHQPTALYPINNDEDVSRNMNSRESEFPTTISLDELTGKRLLAVCGIGNPDSFVSTVEKYHPETVQLLAFSDHHVYTEDDVHQIAHHKKQFGAEWVVTTQKDEHKLTPFSALVPIVVLAVELVITDGEAVLIEALQTLTANRNNLSR